VEDWCTRVGVHEFVRKPFDAPQIRVAVSRALDDARAGIPSSRSVKVAEPTRPSRRLRLDRAALVIGEGETVRALRVILREAESPMQVAAVPAMNDGVRALASITVDVVAVCGVASIADPDLLQLVAAAEERGVPVVMEARPQVDLPRGAVVHVAARPTPDGLARTIQAAVASR
jgi:hypothetical protein